MTETNKLNNSISLIAGGPIESEEISVTLQIRTNRVFSLESYDHLKVTSRLVCFVVLGFMLSVLFALLAKFVAWLPALIAFGHSELFRNICMTLYLSIVSAGVFGVYWGCRERRINLYFSEKGIESPFYNFPSPGTGFKISWSQIESINIVDSYSKSIRGHQFEINTRTGKRFAFEILRLDDDQLENLVSALNKWCPAEILDKNLVHELIKCHEFETAKMSNYALLKDSSNYLSSRFSFSSYPTLKYGFQFEEAPYKVAKVLSAGGISATYSCLFKEKEERCLKELWLEWCSDKDEIVEKVRSFALDNRYKELSGLPDVYESFENNGRLYISTESIAGQSLREYFSKKIIPPSTKQIISIMEQLQIILLEFRRLPEPVVHGGLSPDSIFITRGGIVKIGEPPLLKVILTQEIGDIHPGLNYMAPELIQGKITPAADQYSWGRILFYLTFLQDPEAEINFSSNVKGKPINQIILAASSPDFENRLDLVEATRLLKTGKGADRLLSLKAGGEK